MKNQWIMLIFTIVMLLFLTACGGNDTQKGDKTEPGSNATNNQEKLDKEVGDNMDGVHDGHSSDGAIPEGLTEAENPIFPVGTKVKILGAHFEGMEGSEGTVVGAYNTIAYSVSYQPTTDEMPQENHKWVIREEIQGYGEDALELGAEIIIDADHHEGMKGAQGTIETAQETTVYMVDFTSTTGEKIVNHKWLIESELEAIE